jgi:endonuclease YncB( thermonuclease family)
MKKLSFIIAFIILNLSSLFGANPYTDDTAKVKIIKIYDGDTFGFMYKKELIKIRLLGADTYETSLNERLSKQAEKMNIQEKTALKRGIKAKKFAEEKLLNQKVLIVRDRNEKNQDVFNRLLRYVIVEGERFDSLMQKCKIYYVK